MFMSSRVWFLSSVGLVFSMSKPACILNPFTVFSSPPTPNANLNAGISMGTNNRETIQKRLVSAYLIREQSPVSGSVRSLEISHDTIRRHCS